MKVKRKPTWLLEDCFDAEERGTHVRITRHRSTVILDVSINGHTFEGEMTLEQLAFRLALGEAGERASDRERKSPNVERSHGGTPLADAPCSPSSFEKSC